MTPAPAHVFHDEWVVRALLDEGVVDPALVSTARAEKTGEFVERLVDLKICPERRIYDAVKARHRIESALPTVKDVERLALSLIPERICRRLNLIPVQCDHETVTVAMARPLNMDSVADVEKMTGRRVYVRYCLARNVKQLLDSMLAPELVLEDITAQLRAEEASVEIVGEISDAAGEVISSPVVRLVDTIIAKAVTMRASDIHLEHADNESLFRFRIDGAMRSIMKIPIYSARPVVSRIKIMANLDVAEHRRPQDGRAKLLVQGHEIGLRVSVLPTAHGEKVVLRLLDKRVASVPFDALGLVKSVDDRLRRLITASQGFVTVTGPTGSGKTTTLYSAINLLRSEATNIVTVEDPIEYKLEGINQVQINDKQGLTFAGVLRSVLRQDPNVILVGEIRDRETADVAFQAAMTGHLVLSTLHTNDAISTIGRLIDIGVESARISSGLTGIIAQRLVRRLCPKCRVEEDAAQTDPDAAKLLERYGLSTKVWSAKGCTECVLTGYKGRIPVLELLEIDGEVKELIAKGKTEAQVYDAALASGSLYPMALDVLTAAGDGRTSLAEAKEIIRAFGAHSAAKPGDAASAEAAPEKPAEAALKSDAAAPAAGRRVLVVDDAKTIRVILKLSLKKRGFEVLEAKDGEEGLGLVLSEHPDLLVTDLSMPGLDGLQLVKAIRRDLGMLDIPIVVLTASDDAARREELLSAGVNDYLTKPFEAEAIATRVESMFARRELG